MESISSQNIFNIFRKTLSLVDYRVVEHCERTSYILYKMLEKKGVRDKNALQKACVTALLHDIGAFKTQKMNSLIDSREIASFEMKADMSHCSYGYLFLRHFESIGIDNNAILYHHTPYAWLEKSGADTFGLAPMLFTANRYDILNLINPSLDFKGYFSRYEGRVFSPEAVELILDLHEKDKLGQRLADYKYAGELHNIISNFDQNAESMESFLHMLVFLIDFQSPFTVVHTIMTVAISMELGRLQKFSPQEINNLKIGSLLHDIGKISTPIVILEKEGRLTPDEYNVMKDHVSVTAQILEGCIPAEIVNIAARHHEKLDGTGYPYGLASARLSKPERTLAVADIASALAGRRSYKDSFPEEKIKSILKENAAKNMLDSEIVEIMCNNYSSIIQTAEKACSVPYNSYLEIIGQHNKVTDDLEKGLHINDF